jgi:predicted SAM-dependent methyltransferase
MRGGIIVIITPDMDVLVQQYMQAQWIAQEWKSPLGHARHSCAGFWGSETERFMYGEKPQIFLGCLEV